MLAGVAALNPVLAGVAAAELPSGLAPNWNTPLFAGALDGAPPKLNDCCVEFPKLKPPTVDAALVVVVAAPKAGVVPEDVVLKPVPAAPNPDGGTAPLAPNDGVILELPNILPPELNPVVLAPNAGVVSWADPNTVGNA